MGLFCEPGIQWALAWRFGRPELVSIAGSESASVDVDLVIDEFEVFL